MAEYGLAYKILLFGEVLVGSQRKAALVCQFTLKTGSVVQQNCVQWSIE